MQGSPLTAGVCQCSERSCVCEGHCLSPAERFVKCATVEALCPDCADYALASYDGAREVKPVEERWAEFSLKHPYWAKFLGTYVGRMIWYAIVRRIMSG